jgi:predicted Zn-dependent protease
MNLPMSPGIRCALSAVALAALLSSGCATNPATGKQQISLIGEQQEIAMGQQADGEVSASMGLYDEPDLQSYVQALGEALASESERPHLPWTFRVVDDPTVNAFALPGGYIYITRGIMAHMNSEAELVSVIGHEIGHVTARHSVNQISKQQLAGIGLGLGMIVEPGLAEFADLALQGMQMMFLKFSRDDERQADDLGLRYTLRGGWDPREMEDMFLTLERASEAAGGGSIPGWMSTHPTPGNRQERTRASLASLDVDFARLRVGESSYLRSLDGMVFGENPREGYFDGSLFLHPDMAFEIRFPDGWRYINSREAVGAVSSDEDAVVVVTLAGQDSPESAAHQFLGQEGLSSSRVESGRVNGLPAAWGQFEAAEGQTMLAGQVVMVRHENATFQILAYTPKDRWSRYAQAFNGSQRSFDRLTDRQALNVQPARIETVVLDRSMTLDEFDRRYPSSVPIETVALINQVRVADTLEKGRVVKRVVGGPATR